MWKHDRNLAMRTRNKTLTLIAAALATVCLAFAVNGRIDRAPRFNVLLRAKVCTAKAMIYTGMPSKWAVGVLMVDAVSGRINAGSAMEVTVIDVGRGNLIVVDTSENKRAK